LFDLFIPILEEKEKEAVITDKCHTHKSYLSQMYNLNLI